MRFPVADIVWVAPRSGQWVYTVWVGDVPIYVGQSRNPRRRLLQHFHPTPWKTSALAGYVADHLDEAQEWEIELTSVEGDVTDAEAATIRRLRPSLNCTFSVGSIPMPEHLVVLKREGEQALIAKVRNRRSVL